MTVIIGVKKHEEVWIGSDRRISYGTCKVDAKGTTDSKLIVLDNAIIGAAGEITMRNYMELFVSKGENRQFSFANKLDVMEFFIGFKKFLKRHAGLGDAENNQVQNLHGTDWVIATRDRLYELNEDCGVMEMDPMCIVGCGQHVARGAMEYMLTHEPSLVPEVMLQRAHDVVLKHDIGCGGDQIRFNVTKHLGSPPLVVA